VPHLVGKLAALAQALITLGSPSAQPAHLKVPEQPLSNLSSTHLTNEGRCWLSARIMLFLSSFDDYSLKPKEALKDLK